MPNALGRIRLVSHSGNIIARLSPEIAREKTGELPIRLGIKVALRNSGPIGKVTGIIGPVRAPYIVVKSFRSAQNMRLEGQEIFEFAEPEFRGPRQGGFRGHPMRSEGQKWHPAKVTGKPSAVKRKWYSR